MHGEKTSHKAKRHLGEVSLQRDTTVLCNRPTTLNRAFNFYRCKILRGNYKSTNFFITFTLYLLFCPVGKPDHYLQRKRCYCARLFFEMHKNSQDCWLFTRCAHRHSNATALLPHRGPTKLRRELLLVFLSCFFGVGHETFLLFLAGGLSSKLSQISHRWITN